MSDGAIHCVNCDTRVWSVRELYCKRCEKDPRRLPAARTFGEARERVKLGGADGTIPYRWRSA